MSWYSYRVGWIHCSLNYGRKNIADFCRRAVPYETVLDIGAGYGDDLQLAQKYSPGTRMYAVEVNPIHARRLESSGIAVFPMNIERQRIPLEDRSVDLVIMNQVLEHIKDIYWVFHEVSRVLAVGGKLIVGVPNLASFHNRILLVLGLQPTCIKTNSAHVRGFTRGDILQFLNEVFPRGYQLRRFKGANFYPFPPWLAEPAAALFPSLSWGLFMLFEKRLPYHQEFLTAPVIQELETNFYLGEN